MSPVLVTAARRASAREDEQGPEKSSHGDGTLPGPARFHPWQASGVPRFSRAELESYRDVEVPDLLGPGLRLLFVGINPGLWTAATQTHFARPSNRFYPALLRGGDHRPSR